MKYECAGAWECALPIAMNKKAIRKNKMKNGKNHQEREEITNNRNVLTFHLTLTFLNINRHVDLFTESMKMA